MNQFAAALPPSVCGKGREVLQKGLPATPYENFIAEKERLYRLLLNAGIDDDAAIETAIHVAMVKTTAKLNPDDFEFCKQAYGDFR